MTHLLKNHFIKIMLLALVSIVIAACGNDSTTSTTAVVGPDGIGQYNAENVKIDSMANPELVAKGESIFKASCLPCHKLDDQRLIGPGLKGITQQRTPAWIFNMIVNPTEMNAKDPEAKKLLQTYMTPMAPINLNEQELVALYAFLQKNDA
ncbi:MAG: c-type cytochrome [Chitinophagaceae bacterium]